METEVYYPIEVKMKAIEMQLAKVPQKDIMEKLSNFEQNAIEDMHALV